MVRSDATDSPDAEIRIKVSEGRVCVQAVIESDNSEAWESLLVPIINEVQNLLNVVGFKQGVPYHFVPEDVVIDGTLTPILLADRRLAKFCTAYTMADVETVSDLVSLTPSLQKSLADVMMMLSLPDYAPIGCGRLVDGIVRAMTGGSSPAHWERMRSALNVDRAFLKMLSDHSKPARHGDRIYVPGPTVNVLAKRAYQIMDRYLAFKLGGDSSLDLGKYPMLEG